MGLGGVIGTAIVSLKLKFWIHSTAVLCCIADVMYWSPRMQMVTGATVKIIVRIRNAKK